MSTTVANLAQKNARNAIQRVEALEEVVPKMISVINEGMGKLQQQISSLAEVMEAQTAAIGSESVNTIVMENRRTNDAKKVAAEKEEIAKRVEAGELIPADSIGDSTLMVFEESDKEGKVLPFGSRVQFSFGQLKEEFRKDVVGKKLGDKVVVPEGHSFEVKELYTIVHKAPAQATAQA
jgi:hypothetical protein